jgi:hypothetical protein
MTTTEERIKWLEQKLRQTTGELVQANDRIEALEAALEPFAQTGWMTGEIEHTARTIVAHMHPEREREIILSSDDFKRARDLLALLKGPEEHQP